jgi:hypothetical protein
MERAKKQAEKKAGQMKKQVEKAGRDMGKAVK